MPFGPGVYDDECSTARVATKAHTAILMIIGGMKGSGFSVQTAHPQMLVDLPNVLRAMAKQIEESSGGYNS